MNGGGGGLFFITPTPHGVLGFCVSVVHGMVRCEIWGVGTIQGKGRSLSMCVDDLRCGWICVPLCEVIS